MRVAFSGGHRNVFKGTRFDVASHGAVWEVVEPSGEREYSPSDVYGTPGFWCRHVAGSNRLQRYERADGCVEFCGDFIAAGFIEPTP